jgi:hypothetical protein
MSVGHFLKVHREDQQPGEDAESYYDQTIGAVIVKMPKKKKRKRRKRRKSLKDGKG